jgi:hypothetical protein
MYIASEVAEFIHSITIRKNIIIKIRNFLNAIAA